MRLVTFTKELFPFSNYYRESPDIKLINQVFIYKCFDKIAAAMNLKFRSIFFFKLPYFLNNITLYQERNYSN